MAGMIILLIIPAILVLGYYVLNAGILFQYFSLSQTQNFTFFFQFNNALYNCQFF